MEGLGDLLKETRAKKTSEILDILQGEDQKPEVQAAIKVLMERKPYVGMQKVLSDQQVRIETLERIMRNHAHIGDRVYFGG